MPRVSPVAMDTEAEAPLDGAVVDMAISWFIRLQAGNARLEDSHDFNRWLAASSRHELAWRRIQSIGGRVEDVQADIGLKTLERARSRKQARRSTLKTLGVALAGGGTVAWLATTTSTWQAATADYTTSVGQRRVVRLDDGTEIVMNTDSAMNIRFDDQSRQVDLLCGEICVTTGADAGADRKRPFRIHTEFGMLRALGTRFLVRLEPAHGWLCVEQGAVEVAVADGARITCHVGDTLRFDRRSVVREGANLLPAAWLDGMLIVHSMPLSRFLDELSRYRRGVISCDEAIARLPVSGAYQTGDPDKVLALIAASMGLALSYRTRFWVRVTRADKVGKKII